MNIPSILVLFAILSLAPALHAPPTLAAEPTNLTNAATNDSRWPTAVKFYEYRYGKDVPARGPECSSPSYALDVTLHVSVPLTAATYPPDQIYGAADGAVQVSVAVAWFKQGERLKSELYQHSFPLDSNEDVHFGSYLLPNSEEPKECVVRLPSGHTWGDATDKDISISFFLKKKPPEQLGPLSSR